jgi:exopolysaccharide production protein ExoZ
MLDRIFRVVPLYWIFTTISAILLILLPSMYRLSTFSMSHYILSLMFIPHLNPATQSYSPLLRIGWTLNCEMFFYIVFCAAMLINFRRRAWIVSAIMTFMGVMGQLFHPLSVLGVYANNIMIEFVFGLVLCALYRSDHLNFAVWKSLLLIALGLAGFAAFGVLGGDPRDFDTLYPRSLVWGLPAALVVAGALGLDRAGWGRENLFSLTGDASYSIYLVHLFPIVAIRALWVKLGVGLSGPAGALAFDAIAVASGWCAGILVYFLLERPIMRRAALILRPALQRQEPAGYPQNT